MQLIKRYIPVLLLLLFSKGAFSTNYYISKSGNDNNSGIQPELAWQTINQLNASFLLIQPGDSILFKRNEIFFGTITVRTSGQLGRPIVFSAYGKGNDPVITGFMTIKGWKKKEGNIWEAPAPGIKSSLNVVAIDDIAQRIGRYPNADKPDGGYIRYKNTTANTNIIDSNLDGSVNWTGAEIVIRKNLWTAEKCRITEQEGFKLTFTNAVAGINSTAPPRLYEGTKGFGYFIQKDHRTLDQQGEWFLDSVTHNLQVYLTDTNHLIKAAAADTLVNARGESFLTFSHLSFEGGNISGIYNNNGNHITIQDCSFKNIGAKAIHFWSTGNVLIENVHTNYILSNAIQSRNMKKDNVTVKNCVIKNTAPFIGMGSFFDDRDYKAVWVSALNNVLIENNIIDSAGLSGIQYQGNNVLIQHNLINHYCQLLDDGAGIYTFVEFQKENAGENFFNRVVKNNIILNGRGAPEGGGKIYKAEGIYMDGRSMNVNVVGNTIAYTGNKAFAVNSPTNITLRDNNCFSTSGWGAGRLVTWQDMHNLEVKNNIFYALNDQQASVNFYHSGLDVPEKVTIWEAIRLAGEIDSNYYNTLNPVGFVYNYAPVAGKPMVYPSPLTFENWKELTGQDVHSKRPAKILPLYTFKNNIGSNLVKNGGFDANKDNINVFGSGAECEWDNSGKLTGSGSLKIECTQPQPNRYIMLHSAVGNIESGKNYLFRFKTLGSSECGIVRAYLRKTAAPYDMLTPVQVQSFGSGKQQHEFLLSPNISGNMSFVIEIEKNSCTVYIDDIELYEANATAINLKDHVRFEYNATEKTVDIPLTKNYVGVDGTKYSGTLSLLPFTSKILIEDIVY